jgi:NADH dehydrogenase FAD-containing subunit
VRVVILGGGYAGVAVLKGLLGKVESLTLIEKSDRFYHNIGAPRALVQAGVENTIVLPYDRVLQGKARHVRGVASGVDTSAKTVAVRKLDGTTEAVPYDFLVVATGTSNSLPSKMLTQHSGEAAAALAQMRSAIAAARSVAIVGGGAVGVEVAGEIAVDFAGKTEVHLVHRGASLLSNPENGVLPQKFRDDVRRALEARKVHLHLSTTAAPVADVPTSVVSLNGGRILLGPVSMSLSDGSTLTPDVTLFTTGGRPNNAAFTSGPLSGALDAAGRLKVQPTLQVEGFADIFALGDIAGESAARAPAPFACTLEGRRTIVTRSG